MPLLLEDLAEDAATALARTAERFDAAAEELARPDATGEELATLARRLTAYALAEVPRGETVWRWESEQPAGADAERRWLALQRGLALQTRLCTVARRAWERAAALGVAPEHADELHQAWFRFAQRAHRMKTNIERRRHGWQPKDPERYAREMQAIAEGKAKTVTADEARKWFRPAQAPGDEG